MAKTNYTNIDEYHNTLETAVSSRLQTVRELIHEMAPDVLEVISYQIPAFKIHGKFLIYYAAYRGHISVSSPWSKAFLSEFEEDMKAYKTSRAVIQFPHSQPLPDSFIRRIIAFRVAELNQV